VFAVNNQIRAINAFHADRAARFEAEAQRARIADEIRADRRASQPDERRIRRAIGRSIVRLGARIAADPAVERCLLAAPRGRGGNPVSTLDGVPLQ
jgi:hypothetical protein